MAEVLGIVSGAVGTTDAALRWLGAVRQVIRDFRDAGEKLQMLHDGISDFRTGLQHWGQLWGIEPHKPKTYFTLLWGLQGGDLILRRLSIIGKKYEDFDNTMAMFLSEEIHNILASPVELDFDLQTLAPLPRSGAQQALHRREAAYLAKKKLTPVAKANFVFRKAKEMTSLLSFLNVSLENLHRDALRYFEGTHKKFSEFDEPVESVTNAKWLRSIVGSREASTALHNCCYDQTTTVPVKIDLDLRPPKATKLGTLDLVCTLQYHLIIEDENEEESDEFEPKHRHLLIEGPVSRSQEDIARRSSPDRTNFADACRQMRTASDGSFRTYFASELKWFSARLPPDSMQYSASTFKDLTAAWRGVTEDGFPFGERIELAYQIATCGVMLLGTPWLSSIKSEQIVLSAADSVSPTSFYLKTDRETHRLARKDLWSIGTQIYLMGILLLEIALARPVLGTGSSSQKRRGDVRNRKDIKIASFNREVIPTWYSFAEVFQKVNQRAGRRYVEAVEYCLMDKRHTSHWRILEYSKDDDARIEASCDAVAEYYNTVVLP
jgi:hypothetical protein